MRAFTMNSKGKTLMSAFTVELKIGGRLFLRFQENS